MSSFDQQPELDQGPVQQAPQPSMTDLQNAQIGSDTRMEFDKASKAGDWDTAKQNFSLMRQQAGTATVETLADGGDPTRETRPIGMFVHPDIEIERRGMMLDRKKAMELQTISADPDINDLIKPFYQEYQAKWKERQSQPLPEWNPSTMTPEQQQEYAAALQPDWVDPNRLADLRQRAVKADQRFKILHGKEASLWNHPETKDMFRFLNADASAQGAQAPFQAGEQPMDLGLLGRAGLAVAQGSAETFDIGFRVAHQLDEWKTTALKGLGIPDYMIPSMPTNYIEGPNGELIVNQEHPHYGFLEYVQAANSFLAGRNIQEDVARMGRTMQMEKAQRNGVETLIHGVANVAGAFAGFSGAVGLAGKALKTPFMATSEKGLKFLAGLGVKGAESERALAIVKTMSGVASQVVGAGAVQSTAYGKQQGFVNQALMGMAMIPVVWTLGHFGKGIEGALKKYAKVPGKPAALLAEGMALGVPFAEMEIHDLNLWPYLRDPTESNLQIYLKNIFGTMVHKAGTMGSAGFGGGASEGQMARQRTAEQRKGSRRRAADAKDVYQGRKEFDQAAFKDMTKDEVMQLGELAMRQASEQNLVRKSEIGREQSNLETNLDIRQQGLENPVNKELKQISAEEGLEAAPQKIGKQFQAERRVSSRDQIAQAKEESKRNYLRRQEDISKEHVKIDEAQKEMEVRHEKEKKDLAEKEAKEDRISRGVGRGRFSHKWQSIQAQVEGRGEEYKAARSAENKRVINEWNLKKKAEKEERQKQQREGTYKSSGKVTEQWKAIQARIEGREKEYYAERFKKEAAPVTEKKFSDIASYEKVPKALSPQDSMAARHAAERKQLEDRKRKLYEQDFSPKDISIDKSKVNQENLHKKIAQRKDPITEPGFESRPKAEKDALMAAETLLDRQAIAYHIEKAGKFNEQVLKDANASREALKESVETKAIEGAERHKKIVSSQEWMANRVKELAPKIGERQAKMQATQESGKAMFQKELAATQKRRGPSFEQQMRSGNERRVKSKLPEGQAERRVGERREQIKNEGPPPDDDPRMAAARSSRMPSKAEREMGAEYGPGSMQAVPGRQVQPMEGVKRTTLDDIRAEMKGRLPRKGIQIPFTSKRIGAKPGDPVRPTFAKGRIGGGEGVKGLFKIFENLVRTRGGRDLVVDAHEWSHDMQVRMQSGPGGKRFLDIARQWQAELPSSVKGEFPAILEGYANWERLKPDRQGMEVWAEWHARDLLGDTRLETEAPKLTQYFREQLADPMNAAIREQYSRIKSSILAYTQQGARERVRASRFGPNEKESAAIKATRPSRLQRAMDAIESTGFNENVDLRRAVEEHLSATGKERGELGITSDPVRMRDVYDKTAYKKAEHFILEGIKGPDGKMIPGPGKIFKGLEGRMPEYTDYLVSVMNAQRLMRGNKATLSKTDYVTTIRELQQMHPDFRQKAREQKKWSDALVDFVAESGNLAPEQAQRIKDAYVAWIPFVRRMDSMHKQAGGVSGAVAPVREAVGRVKGGGSERIEDPILAMFDTTAQMISNAHRSEIMGSLYKMAVGSEAGGIASIVPKTKIPKDHPLRVVLEAMEKQVDLGESNNVFAEILRTLKEADALDPQTLTLFSPKTNLLGEKNIIAYTPRLTEAEIQRAAGGDTHLEAIIRHKQGKPVWMEINDPRIYSSLLSLDTVPVSKFYHNTMVGKLLKGSADLTRFFATGIQPAYSATALFRDILTEPMFSRAGTFRPGGGIIKAIQGAIAYHRRGGMRELYEASGVKIASFFNEGSRRRIIGEARTIRQKAMSIVDKVQHTLSAPENYLRIGEMQLVYKNALKEGRPEKEARILAAESAREITVNFARGGTLASLVNPAVPYTRATLAGIRKFGVALAGSHGRNDAERAHFQRMALLNGISNITIPSLIMWYLNHDKDWYQDMPAWQRIGYNQFDMGEDGILQLPRPYETGVIFGAIPEMLMNAWVDENGEPPDMMATLGEAMFPYLKGVHQLIPAAAKPILEHNFNYDIFKGKPITPYWMDKNTIPEEQSYFYTTESSKIMSKVLGGKITPIQIDHLLDGYTAGVGTYALRLVDSVAGLKETAASNFNPFRRLFKEPHQYGRHEDELYDIDHVLGQRVRSDVATGAEKNLARQIGKAKERLSKVRERVYSGDISTAEGNKMRYQIAKPLVDRYEEIMK